MGSGGAEGTCGVAEATRLAVEAFTALAPDVVTRKASVPGASLAFPGGLEAQLFTVPGKVPLYLEGANPDTVIVRGLFRHDRGRPAAI